MTDLIIKEIGGKSLFGFSSLREWMHDDRLEISVPILEAVAKLNDMGNIMGAFLSNRFGSIGATPQEKFIARSMNVVRCSVGMHEPYRTMRESGPELVFNFNIDGIVGYRNFTTVCSIICSHRDLEFLGIKFWKHEAIDEWYMLNLPSDCADKFISIYSRQLMDQYITSALNIMGG